MFKIVQKTFITTKFTDKDETRKELINNELCYEDVTKVDLLKQFNIGFSSFTINPETYEKVFLGDEPVLLCSEECYMRHYDRDISIVRHTEYGCSVYVKVYIVQEYWLEQE